MIKKIKGMRLVSCVVAADVLFGGVAGAAPQLMVLDGCAVAIVANTIFSLASEAVSMGCQRHNERS